MNPTLKAIIRIIIILADNCIAIPAHTAWLLLFQPLYFLFPSMYWYIEGFLYKWLLDIVTSWVHSAGYKGDNICITQLINF